MKGDIINGLITAGALVLVTACAAFIKGIFTQVDVTKDNTKAVEDLTKKIGEVMETQQRHGERIASLEGWRKHGG